MSFRPESTEGGCSGIRLQALTGKGAPARCFDFAFGSAQYDRRSLFPPKPPELLGRANELHCPVIEQNAAALGIVVVESEKFRPAVLIPATFGFE